MKISKTEIKANIQALSEIEAALQEAFIQSEIVNIRLKTDLPIDLEYTAGGEWKSAKAFRDGLETNKLINGQYEKVYIGGISNYVDRLAVLKSTITALNQTILSNTQ